MPETHSGVAVLDRPRSPINGEARIQQNAPTQERKWSPPPITSVKDETVNLMSSHDTFILKGYTGSGKSTFGPVYFLEALKKSHPGKKVRLCVAEPRQMLAEDISETVAKINGVPNGGDLVGFYHGDKQKYSKENTQIVYTVNGSLRNRLQEDLALQAYDGVFLDEIHLRDADQEAILIGLEEAQKERTRRHLPPLKIVVASAAADQRYADYFGNGVVMEVQGQKLHRVDEAFSDRHIDPRDIPIEMAKLAAQKIKDPTHYGDLVGFLPGRAEIQIAMDEFNRIMKSEGLSNKYKCASLTGGGGAENKELQKKLGDDDSTREPIVAFATDVAETGATFPRLTKVIDSGFIRTNVYDPQTGLETLQTLPHSLEHYIQRLGRLGRTGEGEYYALFTEEELHDETKHPKNALPSILKSDLAPLVLSLKTMGIIDPYAVKYMDNPGKEKLDLAVETLMLLGAVNPDGTLTKEGKEMAEIPYDLHFARMLVEAKKLGCAEPVALLVGILNSTSSVLTPPERGETIQEKYKEFVVPGSDFLTLLKVWNAFTEQGDREKANAWARNKGINLKPLFDAITLKRDLSKDESFRAAGIGFENKKVDIQGDAENIKKCIITGLADKILVRSGTTYGLATGKKSGILIGNTSVLGPNEAAYFITGNIRTSERTKGIYAAINQVISGETYRTLAERIGHKNEPTEAVPDQPAPEVTQQTPPIEPATPPPPAPPPPIPQTVKPVEKPLGFFTKIQHSVVNFFKNFLGL